jgi:hypothetical protein
MKLVSLSYFGNIYYKIAKKCRRKSIEKVKMDIFFVHFLKVAKDFWKKGDLAA